MSDWIKRADQEPPAASDAIKVSAVILVWHKSWIGPKVALPMHLGVWGILGSPHCKDQFTHWMPIPPLPSDEREK